jgi:UDP-glucose 4-epimerase
MSAAHYAGGNARRTGLGTGGAGCIGSHTCKALAHAEYLPVTYDSLGMATHGP